MVPGFRLGWMRALNPFTGYIMVLQTTGRSTGLTRSTPLDYAIIDGSLYCVAAWGEGSHWYANLKADPRVRVIMPSGSVLSGLAEEVTDPQEASRAALRVVRSAGFATLFEGKNPLTLTDDEALAAVSGAPVVRIRPDGVLPGPYDPGGRGWVLPTVAQVAGLLWLVLSLRHRARPAAGAK
jgi:deazaflavin-dependent oxidoreductase (nitroreductase family)